MKRFILAIEAIVFLGPITIALCYATILTLIAGIPASVVQLFSTESNYVDLFYPVSAIRNIAGDYLIIVLWLLVVKTIHGMAYPLSKHFYIALVSGAVASISLIYLYSITGFLYGVLPVTLVAIHFFCLQREMQSYS